MRDPGGIAAAIEILDAFKSRPAPLATLVSDWSRGARYAGSKDRAFVRGLCLDALRRWRSYGGLDDTRSAVFLTLTDSWNWPSARVADAFSGEHGPGALRDDELERRPASVPDLPDLALSAVQDPMAASHALAERAPIDLRVNLLKSYREQALKALKTLSPAPAPLAPHGVRIPPPPSADKGPAVEVIPAYGKGWVEIQDEGSQLTTEILGDLAGRQVLDFCAGAGGKSLALAALMGNTGQIYAFDKEASRLAPIYDRLRRAGARNVQVIPPQEKKRLQDIESSMDLVFVDAPCSGSGTWRRHPDAKWRLTEKHLENRHAEQDIVLAEAAPAVKPGGLLVYVTCSFLRSENDERIAIFLQKNNDFAIEDPLLSAPPELRESLAPYVSSDALRLTPWTSGTDGFTVTCLRRRNS